MRLAHEASLSALPRAAAARGLAAAVRDARQRRDGRLGRPRRRSGQALQGLGVSAEIEARARSAVAAGGEPAWREATTIEALISGGDDYEILCAVPQDRLPRSSRPPGPRASRHRDRRNSERRGAAALLGADGREVTLSRGSYSHSRAVPPAFA